MAPSRILFLCTGNYYRSHFSEEYFNHRADVLGLPWIAVSKGLRADIGDEIESQNFGPISVHALTYLNLYLVQPRNLHRYPEAVSQIDFSGYDRTVAVCRREHEPMLTKRFPDYSSRVDYLDIEDIAVQAPSLAIPRLVHALDKLLASLPHKQNRR